MDTLAKFRLLFPELLGHEDGIVERALAAARAIHSLRSQATLYCAAHLVVINDGTEQPDGGQGEVVAESVGGLTSGYLSMAESGRQAFFSTTSYGRMFLTLESRSAYSASVRVY